MEIKYTITEYHGTQVHTVTNVRCQHESVTYVGNGNVQCDECGEEIAATSGHMTFRKSCGFNN